MSSDSQPPPYSDDPISSKHKSETKWVPPIPIPQVFSSGLASESIARGVQTCSINDEQHDYIQIFRESSTSYYVCLTVDHTPLYRISLVLDSDPKSTKIVHIRVFSATNTSLSPIAAARVSLDNEDKRKNQTLALTCASEPSLSDTVWQPLAYIGYNARDFKSSIPIVTIPGLAPKLQEFKWKVDKHLNLGLMWEGDLPPPVWKSRGQYEAREPKFLFASVLRGKKQGDPNVIEIRRGGGLEFELTVIVHAFAILQGLGLEFL